jgi:taurine transport system substrate-binding protein
MRNARAAQEVTVGYQLINSPWAVPITDGTFEKATGYPIRWVKFDSGAKVAAAMASGDLQIGVMGSSPLAAAVSSGVDVQLFSILDDIASSEALVVREGSGIDPKQPETLKSKKLATPFVSTTHFHTMFALELWGVAPDEVELLNMQPPHIAAAWERGDIDAAFVWDPALARIKRSGTVMVTSGELSAKGKATFDGIAVARDFAEAEKEFLTRFVRVIEDANEAYRMNQAAWTPDSPQVKAVAQLFGGEPTDVPPSLSLYRFPTLEEQASSAWLGGGADGGAAKTLKATAEFLKEQGKVSTVLPDYARFVTAEFVERAMTPDR